MKQMLLITIIGLLLTSTPGRASELFFAELDDFRLENGQVIRDCKIGYRTFGSLNEQKSNAILFPTWFGGTSAQLAALIGPGKLVDSTSYFVIAVDALGNGVSSSPSNSESQPGNAFPEFSIHDMVRSQHHLVNEILGIKHLYAIIGGSMGGMQAFDWIISYPDFMDKAIPYVGSPQLTSYDLLLFSTQLLLLEMGLRHQLPADSLLGAVSSIQMLGAQTPGYFVEKNTRDDFPAYFQNRLTNVSKTFTAMNYVAQLRAMINHDIARYFYGDLQKAAAAVKAELLIIVAEQDHLVNPRPALQFAEWIGTRPLILGSDCGHLAVSCEMERVVQAIEDFLKE